MGFAKRLWGYLKALFRSKAEQAMDPAIEVEQAIAEARARDQELRNQAALVVAHRMQLEGQIDKGADEAGEARELAKQALLKGQEAVGAGDSVAGEKWTRSAQALAMRLTAAENNLNALKGQYESAVGQAEEAKKAVQQNAMRLQGLAAKRMELIGSLQQAKMQESVNKAMESLSATVADEGVSLDKGEEKIEQRKSMAMAKAELRQATPEGAEMDLREAISLSQADSKLAELKKELGIGG